MRELWGTGTLGLLMTIVGCGTVKVKHEVAPIHVTVDVNVQVQQKLNEVFDFEEDSNTKDEQTPTTQKNKDLAFLESPLALTQARMEERYSELKKLKKVGTVGETNLGYVEVVTEKYAKDKDIQKILAAENADREELYRIIANQSKTSVEVVAKNNALRIFEKANDEEYFEGKDGKWRQKKKMKKKN